MVQLTSGALFWSDQQAELVQLCFRQVLASSQGGISIQSIVTCWHHYNDAEALRLLRAHVDKHGVGSEYRWLNEQRCVAPVPCTCEESDDKVVEPVAGGELTAVAEAETAVEAGRKKSLGPVGVAFYKRLGLLPDCYAALVAMDTVEAAGAAVEAAVECGSEAAVEAAAGEELASEDYYYDDASSPGLDDSDTNLFTVIEAKYGWKIWRS